jgi:hypothetical protein
MKDIFKFYVCILIGAICFLTDAFYNNFPLVTSDTSTYIASGFELEAPFDRPITYGLFLRLFSLNGFSLWFVILFQALILSYLIFLLIKLVIGEKLFLKFGLITITLLSFFTSASWTVSQVMPDIFTSISLLCIPIILLGKFETRTFILLHVIFFISVAMHMSHILLFSLIIIGIFAFRKLILPDKNYFKRNIKIITLLILTISSLITMGSAISKSKHVFFMAAMVEHGITKEYLDEYCVMKSYKLCAYKDSMPNKAYKFIWDERSPFYKIGGWKGTKKEFEDIIYETITKPKYIIMHIKESCKATFQQLILFGVGDGNQSFLQGTLLYKRISYYFPNDLYYYSTSKQSQTHVDFIEPLNVIFLFITVLSLIIVIILVKRVLIILRKPVQFIIILFSFTILLNAWDCGTFANALSRLEAKIIWLIPFMAILFICTLINNKRDYEGLPM